MRVLHLNTHTCGGSYEYAVLLSTALAEHGIESRVLCKSSQPKKSGRLFLDRVIRRSYVSFSTEPWHGTRRLLSPPAAEDLEGVDVIHLHMVADWFDVPAWLETLPRRIGVVISVHDMWHVTGGCFLYRGNDRYANQTNPCDPCPILRWPANRFLAKTAYRRKLQAYRNCGARLIANSRWLAEIAGRSGITKACGGVRVIPPGIDTAVFKPQDKALCRKHVHLPADAFVIITGATSLNDTSKNVRWLFEQLSRLPDLHNVIVLAFGEGKLPMPDGLNIRFTGGIRDRHELAQLFAAADVFVSASLMETYGLTLVEAMACGTPVVAFRVGGIPETAPDGQAALLFDPLDATAFLVAIQRLRSSAELRERLGHSATDLAVSRNNERQLVVEFIDVYRQCVRFARTLGAQTPAFAT
jgi:glycosyltransferase involved in cell wall biosynthesis